jgi:hypothetical protein
MLEAGIAPFAEEDGDDVEAAGRVTGVILGEIAQGDLPDLPLLSGGDGFLGAAVGFVGAGLDLDENQRLAVLGDDVDLAAEQAETPGEDGVVFMGPATG